MPSAKKPTLRQLSTYFLRLGTFGFGGPVALIGYMENDLVHKRRWVDAEDFKEGLVMSQLAPGPVATQLAMYLGYVHSGLRGSTAVALALVLPSFLMVLAIAAAYERYGSLGLVRAAFYGVGAAVIAIIARSAYRLARRQVPKRALPWATFAVVAVYTVFIGKALGAVLVTAGLLALAWENRSALLLMASEAPAASAAALPLAGAPQATAGGLAGLFLYFFKAGALVFGSGLAIVPFLYDGVVHKHHWLTDSQFLDAVAVAMITPGPAVITVAFIGYLAAGLAGATLAALGVFLPIYLIVALLSPWFRRNAHDRRVRGFVEGVTAAALGSIAGSAFVLGRQAIQDFPSALIAAASLAALTFADLPEPILVAIAAAAGILIKSSTI